MKDRRADFVSKAIAALEELDTKPRKADAKALALKAFEKLQYDFPVGTSPAGAWHAVRTGSLRRAELTRPLPLPFYPNPAAHN